MIPEEIKDILGLQPMPQTYKEFVFGKESCRLPYENYDVIISEMDFASGEPLKDGFLSLMVKNNKFWRTSKITLELAEDKKAMEHFINNSIKWIEKQTVIQQPYNR